MQTFLNYWWIIPIVLAVLGYKFILRVFFGMVIIPEDKIGIVTKHFVLFGANKELPDGRVIATKGEAGIQAKTLAPGLYWGMWIWQYSIDFEKFTVIQEGTIGLVIANDGAMIPTGAILGRLTNANDEPISCDSFQDTEKFLETGGQKGRQSAILTAGMYRINTKAFSIQSCEMTRIDENMLGIVTALDGQPIPNGKIAGDDVFGHKNFQDFDEFLRVGGYKGLQPQVILAGSYNINPWAIQIEEQPMTDVQIGYVGVVISYIGEDGEDTSGVEFKHGNIVKKGHRGVWGEAYGPGKYPINKYTHKIEVVPTTNLVLNWADSRNESHKLDANLSTITVRSKDGFKFNLDVSQIIHVPATEAPKVIARFGSMTNLVSQVLEPTIGNYFRNSAQDNDVISFLDARKERQENARNHIKQVLEEYNVNAVDTLIGDITPPDALMKTLTDRKIAHEEETTYKTQQQAQISRQGMEQATALADMQGDLVRAKQSVEISQREGEAQIEKTKGTSEAIKIKANADAEARKALADASAYEIRANRSAEAEGIEKVGKAEAEAYKLKVNAMGEDNFTKFKIMEQISDGKVKIIPDVLIGGNGQGNDALSGLLGMHLMQIMKDGNVLPIKENTVTEVK